MTTDALQPTPDIYYTLYEPGIVFRRSRVEGIPGLDVLEIRQIGQDTGSTEIYYAIVPAQCTFDERDSIEFDQATLTITSEGHPTYTLVEISEDDLEFPDDPIVLRLLQNHVEEEGPIISRVFIEHRAVGTITQEAYDIPFEDTQTLDKTALSETTIKIASRILTPKVCGECPVQRRCKPHRNAIQDAMKLYSARSQEEKIGVPDMTPPPDSRN